MEEEIDLRDYVNVLVKWWKWILLLMVIVAVTAAVISLLLPPTYEAIATLAVTQPLYVGQFDPRFESVEVAPRYKAFSSLVKTAHLAAQVITALDGETDEELTVEDLLRMATVSQGDDPSIIFLKVRHRDPEFATLVANTWSQLYVAHARELYGYTEVEESGLEAQLREAEDNLTAADDFLVQFEAESQIPMLQEEITATSQSLAGYLSLQERIHLLMEDAESLQDRFSFQSSEGSTLGDSLSVLLLEVGSLSAVSVTGLPLNLELSLDESAFGQMTLEEQRQSLNHLSSSLMERQEAISFGVERLSLELPLLRGELQQELGERERLVLDRDVAKETYRTLSRKLDEAKVTMNLNSGVVTIASPAYEPTRPVAPRKILNVAIASVLAFMLGVFGAFAVEYLSGGKEVHVTETTLPREHSRDQL